MQLTAARATLNQEDTLESHVPQKPSTVVQPGALSPGSSVASEPPDRWDTSNDGFYTKTSGFLLKMIDFILKLVDFILQMMDFPGQPW